LVGVFSLELARQYGYLYQQSDKEYVILHDLNGYDEISLTGPFKVFSNLGEDQLEPADLNLPEVTPSDISGGDTVEEAAEIFIQILEGKGTAQQNAVVIANAGMALYCGNKEVGIMENIKRAEKALLSGAALNAFKKLLS
jgi:anthranilate phosphoribosyltransferase